jgi:hypothetical protein
MDIQKRKCQVKPLPTYTDKNFIKFVRDCQKDGLKVEHTDGISDHRPFVQCVNLFDVKEATDVKIQWIRKQSQFIVFPAKSKVRAAKFNANL